MLILLCGEGNHDIGEHVWDKKTGEWVYCEGWLQPLIRSVLGDDVQFKPVKRRDVVLLPRQHDKLKPLPAGHGARALFTAIKAKSEGCDKAVFMADTDSADLKKWEEKRGEIQEGFDRGPDEIKTAACLPRSTSECWLLSDNAAWEKVRNSKIAPLLPSKPEECWGARDDPAGNHPKHVFARACHAASVSDGREVRRAVAEHSSPQALEESCPVSFRDFVSCLSSFKEKDSI